MGFPYDLDWKSFCYLSIPIILKGRSSSDWMDMLSKLTSNFNTWGSRWLNKARKTILIKSMLSSLPLYQGSILLAPKLVME